jgi:tetratricopeptide (TPR) repeat protein
MVLPFRRLENVRRQAFAAWVLLAILAVVPLFGAPQSRDQKENHQSAGDLLQQAGAKKKSKEFPEAVALYSQVLDGKLFGSPIEQLVALYGRGEAHLELGAYNRAVEDLTSALELMPKITKGLADYKAQAYFERGRAYDGLVFLEKAVADYTQCIILDPEYIRAYNNRAVAHYKLKKYREAIADANEYLKRDSGWPEAYYVRGGSKIELMDRSGITDLKIAAGMGHKYAQEALRKAGINW